MAEISIIVPAFNEEDCIANCLDKIVSQSFEDWELILIDDGSTDGTLGICQDYAARDSRIKLISQENKGRSAARNAGLEVACGKYLVFVDADDWMEPGALEAGWRAMEEHGLDLVIGSLNTRIVDGDKEVSLAVSKAEEDFFFNMEDLPEAGPRILALSAMLFFCVWSRMYRTDIVKDNGILFDTNIAVQEDVTFTYDYYYHCKKCMVSSAVFYNYVRGVDKDDVADNPEIAQYRCVDRSLRAFLRLDYKFKFAPEFRNTVLGWSFLHYYVLSSKLFLAQTALPEEEQRKHVRAIEESFTFLYMSENMASFEPFWACMAQLRAEGDHERIFVEWRQKVLGGWGEDMVESDTWAKKDTEQLAAAAE